MIDLGNDTDRNRLWDAIRASRQAMEPFRRKRFDMVREYVGSNYSYNGATYDTLVNLMFQTADTYQIALAANNPEVKISSQFAELAPFANRFTIGINNLIKAMHLNVTFQRVVLDAFFCVGMAKVFLGNSGEIEVEQDVWCDPGRPFVDHISVDDLVLDMNAQAFSKCRFIGNFYRIELDRVRQEPTFDPKVVTKLKPTNRWERDVPGGGGMRTRDISSQHVQDWGEIEDMTDLLEVYLPQQNLMVTFAVSTQEPLRVMEWDGPQGGPFVMLSFSDAPDNVMPVAPAMNLKGLHDLFNGLFRKTRNQAMRHKINPAFAPGSEDDADRLKRVSDGQWVKVRDPAGINVIQQGGASQANVAFSNVVYELFNRMSGNIEAMAGLGPQTGTVGQEQILQQHLGRKEGKMLGQVNNFAREVVRKLAYLMWCDVLLEIPGYIDAESGPVESDWTPTNRQGDFMSYKFDISPYSMMYDPPEAKLGKIDHFVQEVGPLWPMFAQGGAVFDGQELVKIYADLLRIPEIERIVRYTTPPQAEGVGNQAMEQEVNAPPMTVRRNIRQNVPTSGTPGNRMAMLAQAMAATAGPSPDQGKVTI